MFHPQRYFIELAYKGTAYHGWQFQPNAIAIQEVLNQALQTYFRENIETLGCGRTDAGVHATQFFAHLDLQQTLLVEDFSKIKKSLNGLLPDDISLKNIFPVQADAHARFDAVKRSYEYHIHFDKDPFKTDLSWLIKDKLDLEAMQTAAQIILQYEDFGAFCKSNADNFTNICKLSKSEFEFMHDGIIYHVSANRFLRNMVRAIVGTLIDIGKQKMAPEAMHQIIQSQNRAAAGSSVPAHGLFLTEVIYPYINI